MGISFPTRLSIFINKQEQILSGVIIYVMQQVEIRQSTFYHFLKGGVKHQKKHLGGPGALGGAGGTFHPLPLKGYLLFFYDPLSLFTGCINAVSSVLCPFYATSFFPVKISCNF